YNLEQPQINDNWTLEGDNVSTVVRDSITPTINGSVTAETISGTPNQLPIVEFDLDGDGNVDDTVQTTLDVEGHYVFTYSPSGLAPGAISIQARAVRYEPVGSGDNATDQRIEGDWQTLTFTLLSTAPQITSVSLNSPAGTSGAEALESVDPT